MNVMRDHPYPVATFELIHTAASAPPDFGRAGWSGCGSGTSSGEFPGVLEWCVRESRDDDECDLEVSGTIRRAGSSIPFLARGNARIVDDDQTDWAVGGELVLEGMAAPLIWAGRFDSEQGVARWTILRGGNS